MPRRKHIRHFDSRAGVSQVMINEEAAYVAREHQDYLILSTTDLRQKVQELRSKWHQADQMVEQLMQSNSERDGLAFECLIVRDLYFVMELYASCLGHKGGTSASSPPASRRHAEKLLPFSEWLFEEHS